MWYRLILGEFRHHVTATKSDEGPFIIHLVAVFWCAENGDAVSSVLNFIPLILHLKLQNRLSTLPISFRVLSSKCRYPSNLQNTTTQQRPMRDCSHAHSFTGGMMLVYRAAISKMAYTKCCMEDVIQAEGNGIAVSSKVF